MSRTVLSGAGTESSQREGIQGRRSLSLVEITLRARDYVYRFPRPTLVMGILNVTPDSFSDGGQFFDPEAAITHARDMIAAGAEIIDVGGESTRPQATPVSETEELRRVLPVIAALAREGGVPLAIDTQKPGVARAAVAAGASIVNDIGANREDPEMARLVADSGVAYVAMHMQGTPQTMQQHPTYNHVVQQVGAFFTQQRVRLEKAGVHQDQIIFDVGIGFGKTLEHNLTLLGALKSYMEWQRPLLLGVSRKSFIEKLLGVPLPARLPAGLACACWAVQAGVQLIRVHDVAATIQAVRMTEALLAHSDSWIGPF